MYLILLKEVYTKECQSCMSVASFVTRGRAVECLFKMYDVCVFDSLHCSKIWFPALWSCVPKTYMFYTSWSRAADSQSRTTLPTTLLADNVMDRFVVKLRMSSFFGNYMISSTRYHRCFHDFIVLTAFLTSSINSWSMLICRSSAFCHFCLSPDCLVLLDGDSLQVCLPPVSISLHRWQHFHPNIALEKRCCV